MPRRTPTREQDRERLAELADIIDAGADAYEERRVIWQRRYKPNGGDTEGNELAEWSRVSRGTLMSALRPTTRAGRKVGAKAQW